MFVAPAFYQPNHLLSLLAREAPTLVVACGMALVIISQQIDISVGSQFAVCNVTAGLLAITAVPLVFLAAVGCGAVMGAFNGWLVAGLRLPSIVVTLATMVTWREALRWLRQGQFVNLPGGTQVKDGLSQRAGQWTLILTALAIPSLLALAMKHLPPDGSSTRSGRMPKAARLAGIRPQLTTFCVFVFLRRAGWTGSHDERGAIAAGGSKSGSGLELKVIAAAVVGGVAVSGGRRKLWGVFVGLLLLATISQR